MATQKRLANVWASNGVSTDPATAGYLEGWVVEIPAYEEMNYILNALDGNTSVLAEQSYFNWQTDINYKAGAVLWQNGVQFTCKTDHIGQDPEADATQSYWVQAPTYGKAANLANASEGLFLYGVAVKSSNTWGASDQTIFNNSSLINFATASSSYSNYLFGNVQGQLVAIDVDNVITPDDRPILPGDPGVYRIFHEGNPPTIADVGEGLGENPVDGNQYLRKNTSWVILNKATASIIAAGIGGDFTRWNRDYITAESLANSGLYATVEYVNSQSSSFPAGTQMVFVQAAPPPGWTVNSSISDRNLVIHPSLGGQTGGSENPRVTTHTHSTGSHTLTQNEMPNHKHRMTWGSEHLGPNGQSASSVHRGGNSSDTNNYEYDTWGTGGNASHNHGSTGAQVFSPRYVGGIVCTKT